MKSRLLLVVCSIVGLFVLIASTLMVASAVSAAGNSLDISIDWKPTHPEQEGAVWLAYLMSRAAYVEKHPAVHLQRPGLINPTFEEEVDARKKVAQTYVELKQHDKALELPYFNDLAIVDAGSWISEYVWTYLRQPEWKTLPTGLRLIEFDKWRKTHLINHKVVTKGALYYKEAQQ